MLIRAPAMATVLRPPTAAASNSIWRRSATSRATAAWSLRTTTATATATTPWNALGINCPGELEFDVSFTGDAQQVHVHTGQLGTYDPPTDPVLEGEKMVILSSGMASEMALPGDQFASTHAGTKWLSTTAGVVPGEDITLIWAIFDLSDEVLDSVVILDAFSWNCEGGPPQTIPG
jgi:hypothetical protein